MPVEVSCPGCGSKLKAPETLIGKKAKCKKCNTSFRIPGPVAADSGTADPQLLSVVVIPVAIPSNDDESVPMALAVEESDIPPSSPASAIPPVASDVASLPSADPFDFAAPAAKNSLAEKTVKPSAPSTPVPPVAANPPSKTVKATAPPSSNPEPIPPDEPIRKSKNKGKNETEDRAEVKPKKQIKQKREDKEEKKEEKEVDPFTPSVTPTQETVNSDNPFAFDFGSTPPAPAKEEKKDSKVEVEEKAKSKSSQKTHPAENKPKPEKAKRTKSPSEPVVVSSDPFSFNSDPTPSSRKEPLGKSGKKTSGNVENDSNAKTNENDGPAVQKNQRKSSKKLLLAAALGLVVIGGGIAAVAFMKTGTELAKTTDKNEVPATQPPESPKEEPKSSTKDNAIKDPARKDPPEQQKASIAKSESPPVPVPLITLPAKLKTFDLRAPKEKPSLIQQPSEPIILVDVPFEKVKRFFPTANRVNKDAVVVWQSKAGVSGRGEKLSVDTYSASTGFKAGRFEFDGDGRDAKCDVSADGMVFAAVSDGKVTVWNLADKIKVFEGFDPYADKPTHKKAGIAAVYIPNNSNNFLTVSTAGAMHLFEIATKNQIGEYIPENGLPGKVVQGRNLAAEETRLSVAVAVGGSIHQVSTLAPLSLSWKLPIRGEASRSFGLSVAGTPGGIAYAFETETEKDKKKDQAILFCLPNKDPFMLRWKDAVGEPVSVNWSGTEFAVVGTTRGAVWFEYDSEGKSFIPLAMAQVPDGKSLHETTELAHWYLIPNPGDATKSLMLELPTPIADLIDFRNAAVVKQPLETLNLNDKGLWR